MRPGVGPLYLLIVFVFMIYICKNDYVPKIIHIHYLKRNIVYCLGMRCAQSDTYSQLKTKTLCLVYV